jgi:hypothetical protein
VAGFVGALYQRVAVIAHRNDDGVALVRPGELEHLVPGLLLRVVGKDRLLRLLPGWRHLGMDLKRKQRRRDRQ